MHNPHTQCLPTVTPEFQKQLQTFLREAARNFRNGPHTEIVQNPDGSRSVTYTRKNWRATYHFAPATLDSTMSVEHRDRLVFMVACATQYIDHTHHAEIERCLHDAIAAPDGCFPVRGSNDAEHSEREGFCYHNRCRNLMAHDTDLTQFDGSESVTAPDARGHLICLYSATYSGGIVVPAQA